MRLGVGVVPVRRRVRALTRCLERGAEEMRDLYEAGEIEWADLNPRSVWEWAFA